MEEVTDRQFVTELYCDTQCKGGALRVCESSMCKLILQPVFGRAPSLFQSELSRERNPLLPL